MTVRESIQLIIDEYAKGVPSDDNRLRPRRVYAALKNARAMVLAQVYEKHGKVSAYNHTTLPCVKLKRVTAKELGCPSLEGCYYYTTECELPPFVGKLEVFTQDASIQFSEVEHGDIHYVRHSKYTARMPRWFIQNGSLRLINVPELLSFVTIRGAFEDPTEVRSACYNCDCGPCENPLDQQFPFERRYQTPILVNAYRQLFVTQTQQDRINNGVEDGGSAIPTQT